MPHSQQFWEGTLNSGESAHSCPGMSALLAQCPSVTYDRHVPPYWFLQPGVSMQPTGAEAGGLPAAADSKVATPPFSFAGDCLAGEGGVPPSFPHTQQCFPASPKLAAAAHSWPVVKPAPLQWPSFTKSWHVPPYWLRHPGVSVQPPEVGIGNPASRKSAAQCRTARAHSTGAICGAHRHQDGGRPQGSYSIIIQYHGTRTVSFYSDYEYHYKYRAGERNTWFRPRERVRLCRRVHGVGGGGQRPAPPWGR